MVNTIHSIADLLSERPGETALGLLPGIATWSFRLALIIAAGLIAVALLRRCSAALRGAVLTISMVVAMLLPLVGRGLPALRLLSTPEPAVETVAKGDPDRAGAPPASEGAVAVPGGSAGATPKVPVAIDDRGGIAWAPILSIVWVLGAMLVVGRYFTGLLVLRQVRRGGSEPGESLLAALRDAKRRMGVRREVDLVTTEKRSMPMTWGVIRPVVLLPTAVGRDARSVLLHELAHIRRHDALAQLFETLVVALHWFNPVVLFAKRKLVALREEACDEEVLSAGDVKASDYATMLVDLSAGVGVARCEGAAGLAMADSSRLGVRVKAILRAVRPGEQRWVRITLASLFALLAVGLCAFGAVLTSKPRWGKEVRVTLSLEPGKSRVTFPHGEFDDEDHLGHSHYLLWRDHWAPGLALRALPDGRVALVVQNTGVGPASGDWDRAARLLPPMDDVGQGVLGIHDVSRFGEIPLDESFDRGLDQTSTFLLERYGRMQLLSFDKEKRSLTVRFQFREPLAPLISPTRGLADDEPTPSVLVYVPEEILPCATACGEAFGRRFPQFGPVRADAPRHPIMGLSTKKGIAITDWRPEREAEHSAFAWMRPLDERVFGSRAEVGDEGRPRSSYYLYHWPQATEAERAFLKWLGGEEAGGIIAKHGVVTDLRAP